MPIKEFLEDYPLFRKFSTELPRTLDSFPKPAVHMNCEICDSEQTFNMINEYFELYQYSNVNARNTKVRLEYLCQSCQKFTREFNVYFSQELDFMYKFGQYPAWEIKIDKNLSQMLGKFSSNYKKGLICESQGYGIGAFAYYRRITEEIIDELLDSIFELVDENGKENYKEALEKTKTTRVTQDKIDLVKDLLPSILRPSGMNPLGVLHSELSEGIHANSDKDCLEIAAHIREILTFLVNQIIRSKESAKQFTASMQSLLDKKSKK